jgi:hypothetical protein
MRKASLFPNWHEPLAQLLCLAGVASIALVVHLPTHLASAAGHLLGQPAWVDSVSLGLPATLQALFWIPVFLLLAALVLQNRGAAVIADRAPLTRHDLLVGVLVAVLGGAIRLWPLFQNPWLKPNYDEGVYLGAAWLLRTGALPYRDFVFAHLPGALAMLWPAADLIAPGRDNTLALLVARATAALSDSATIGLIYLAARQLVAAPGALLAALVYGSDAFVVQFARGVRLEPLQAPWMVAGALLILATLNGRRSGYAAGLLLAVGLSIKITGAVTLVAALVVLILERRWMAARDVAVGAFLGGIAICGWALVTSGDEIIRQVVLLQLSRPADPTAGRWRFVLGDSHTAVSAVSLLAGAAALGTLGWRRRVASGWLFIFLWMGLTLMQFAYASSFYDHYYGTLVPPLALLAAAIPSALRGRRWRWIAGAGLASLLAPLWWGQALLWSPIGMTTIERQAFARVVAFPPQDRVLNFMPLLNVVAGRPFAHPAGGPYILDTFLGTLYLDSPLNHRWTDAFATMQAAIESTDAVVTDPWTQPLPGLAQSFAARWLVPNAVLLYTRVDQPATLVQIGPKLQMLGQPAAQYSASTGERWVVQPINWRATETPPPDLALALHMLDANGALVAQLDVPVNGNIDWKPAEVTTLDYRVPLPASLAPGTYQIKAIVYSWIDGARVPMQRASGATADTIDLPAVTIPR